MFCTACGISSTCQRNLYFHNYFFVSNNIAQVKETRRPNNAGANTTPLPVTIKNTQRIKENNRETIVIVFFISKHPFWKLIRGYYNQLDQYKSNQFYLHSIMNLLQHENIFPLFWPWRDKDNTSPERIAVEIDYYKPKICQHRLESINR